MYSLNDYVWMIADGARVGAYAAALRALISPGCRVLEVGAGFGFFSVLAARAGAGHVDAVETNPVVHLGPKIAAVNGCADRIRFHHRDVTRLTLDEPADLLLIDVRGPTPFGRRALETLIDARTRLVRPGAFIIAAADTVLVAPARTPAVFRREVAAAHGQQDVVLEPVERIVYDTPIRCAIAPDDLLAGGRRWTHLDYATLESTDASGHTEWTFDRPVAIDGLALWFATDLGGGVGFSTAPGEAVTAYRHMFVPFRTQVPVDAGERLTVHLSARQVRDSYLWEWRVATRAGDAPERVRLHQNSLAELVLDSAAFPHTATGATPRLGDRGHALHGLLGKLDGSRTIETLASELHRDARNLFPSIPSATAFVGDWVMELERLERGGD